MSRLQELKRDRARLDWLIDQGVWVYNKPGAPPQVRLPGATPALRSRSMIRAAIDAAMAKGEAK